VNTVEIQSLLTQRIGVRWNEDRLRDLDHFLGGGTDASDENALTEFMNGETYFFRYPLYMAVLQTLLDRHPKDRPFRVLSAACSSGEEAYSVVFALLDRAVEAGVTLQIDATDVRARAIAAARRGIYGQWSFRNVPAVERSRFFEEMEGGASRVREPYRSTPRFTVRNVLDPVDEVSYDAVLLCNATLYMEPQAARRAYGRIKACLRPEGLLLIAPTDPPPGTAWTQAEEYGGWSVFRRAGAEAEAPAPVASPGVSAGPLPTGGHASRSGIPVRGAGSASRLAARPRSAPVRAAPLAPPPPVRPAPWAAASPAALSAIGSSASSLWVAWANGSLVSAQDELRQRIFLEPGSALWRFLHGIVLWEQGWLKRAASEIERAAVWAAGLEDDASVAGLCTAEELKRMIQFWRSRHA
jgi:chemotaxis methyl-accepting protein methylase